MASTNIRCGKNVKGLMDEFLEETDRYDTQTDFVNTAIRNQIDREQERVNKDDLEDMLEQKIKKLK